MNYYKPEQSMRQIMTLEQCVPPKRPAKTEGLSYEIAQIIRRLRLEQRLSLSKLSAFSGISQVMISGLENGYRTGSIEVFKRIFDTLDYPLSKVFIEIEAKSQRVQSPLSIRDIDSTSQPLLSLPTNGTEISIQPRVESNKYSTQLSTKKHIVESQSIQSPLLIRELRYFIHVEYGKLSAKCQLTLCYRKSYVTRKLELPGYRPITKFAESKFFVSLLETTLSDLKQVINKVLVNGEALDDKFQPIASLIRKHPAIKSELGRIEGLGWSVFIRDGLKTIELVDENKLLLTNADAINHARTAGYVLDSRGIILNESKE